MDNPFTNPGFVILTLVALAAAYMIVGATHSKCPRCSGELVNSETHPNVRECSRCRYIKVDD